MNLNREATADDKWRVAVGGGGNPTYVVVGDGSPREEGNAISKNVFTEER